MTSGIYSDVDTVQECEVLKNSIFDQRGFLINLLMM